MAKLARRNVHKPKRNKRRRTNRRKTVNVNRALAPIPQRYITKLKYVTTVTTSLVNGTNAFRLNSLFDPDQTGLGHQPYGYDQLAQLYNRYRVISCGWRIQCPKTDQIVQFGVLPANEVLTYSSFDQLKEQPRARYFTQMPSGNAMTISGKISLPSLVGRTSAAYMADDRYQADVGSNPLEAAILNCMAATVLDAPLTGAAINVILEFTAEFFDVKNQAQS